MVACGLAQRKSVTVPFSSTVRESSYTTSEWCAERAAETANRIPASPRLRNHHPRNHFVFILVSSTRWAAHFRRHCRNGGGDRDQLEPNRPACRRRSHRPFRQLGGWPVPPPGIPRSRSRTAR